MTLRLSNDFAEGTGDRAGWRGPAVSAVLAEDPQEMVGKTAVPMLSLDGQSYASQGSYTIDDVRATSEDVTVHAVGEEAVLDKTLEQVSGTTDYTRLTASTRPVTWSMNVMAAAGWSRSSISYSGGNATLGAACQLDPSMTVAEAVSGLLASSGRGYVVASGHITISALDSVLQSGWTGAYGWPVPETSERYGRMVVHDPASGSSREATLDESIEGTLEVTVPYSASMDLATLTAWAKARYADTIYSAEVPGSGLGWSGYAVLEAPVARWASGSGQRQQWMRVQRIERHYDGGYRETLTGTLGSVRAVPT